MVRRLALSQDRFAIDGHPATPFCCVVTVDGEQLNTYADTKCYSRYGFEWSYEGPGRSQLAYAMLVDHLGVTAMTERLKPTFTTK
jgi:hypothetical protein